MFIPGFKSPLAVWHALLIALAGMLASISSPPGTEEPVPSSKKTRPDQVVHPTVITIHGPINGKLSKYFLSRLHSAKSSGTNLLIVDIDSPGGLKDASLDIAERLRDIDWAYTVAFVGREAYSGASLIILGCDELVVSPTSRLGDVGLVHFDPQQFAFRFAPAKLQSVFIREARDLAVSKGRPPELAEAMIDKDVDVYQQTKFGKRVFKLISESDEPPGEPWKLIPETEGEKFLTLSGARAKELGLAETMVDDVRSLPEEFGYSADNVVFIQPNVSDSVVYYLNHPIGTFLLIVIGLIALFIEFTAPGIGAGGLVSGLCAVLFFWSRVLGGTSTWLEVLLFIAGVAFLAMELFVIPGWGISGVLGLLLMVCSVFMASQDFVLPASERQWNEFITMGLIIICSGLIFLIAAVFLTKKMGHLPMFNRLILAPPAATGISTRDTSKSDAKSAGSKPGSSVHPSVSVGDWGRANSPLRPAGRAVFANQSFEVVSDGSFIPAGAQIRVVDIQGSRIVVTAIDEDERDQQATHES
jgi:membrane-bound serine protease (ClpP class)